MDSHLGNSVRPRIPEPRNYGSNGFYDLTLVPVSRDVTVNNVEFCDLTIPEIAFGGRNQVSSFKGLIVRLKRVTFILYSPRIITSRL